ncbi:hypothetical protein PCNPT3_08745 [Psychromonas sp. CNPT3]|nr:hypothetical protein PCNPT3_08745 [Psychromonas sp. CNPT3]
MLTKTRIVQLLLMLVLLIGLVVWQTYSKEKTLVVQTLKITQIQRCDDVKECQLDANSEYWIKIDEDPIKAEQWINFTLQHKNKEMQVLSAKIVGKNMYMGEIKLDFKENANKDWKAKVILAACTMPMMRWSLQIQVKGEYQPETLMFDFNIQH